MRAKRSAPEAEIPGVRARGRDLLVEPGAEIAERLGGAGGGPLEILLEPGVLHGREQRRHVLLQVAGEAAEGHLPELGVGARHRGGEVGPRLRHRSRHRPGPLDERPHPLVERRVVAGEIEAGIDGAGVEHRVAPGPLGRLQPEEVGVDHHPQHLSLEGPPLVERRGIEFRRPLAFLLQPGDLAVHPLPAPVRQPAVEFMPPGAGREGGVQLEVPVQERAQKMVPPPRHHRGVQALQALGLRVHGG